MDKMKRKRRIRKKNKWTLVPVLVIGVVIILVAATLLYQGQPSKPERKEAKEYFEVVNPTVDTFEFRENRSVIAIREMSFSLKAVGGDATHVVVNHRGYYLAEPWEVGNMTMGQVVWVPIKFPPYGPYVVEDWDKGFSIEIPVHCEEAEGNIIINL